MRIKSYVASYPMYIAIESIFKLTLIQLIEQVSSPHMNKTMSMHELAYINMHACQCSACTQAVLEPKMYNKYSLQIQSEVAKKQL